MFAFNSKSLLDFSKNVRDHLHYPPHEGINVHHVGDQFLLNDRDQALVALVPGRRYLFSNSLMTDQIPEEVRTCSYWSHGLPGKYWETKVLCWSTRFKWATGWLKRVSSSRENWFLTAVTLLPWHTVLTSLRHFCYLLRTSSSSDSLSSGRSRWISFNIFTKSNSQLKRSLSLKGLASIASLVEAKTGARSTTEKKSNFVIRAFFSLSNRIEILEQNQILNLSLSSSRL